ncbi:MucBP domain-containing protein [Levilactobacillus lindianensis]|uniref:MucBP domain-containing protein n=1 Tax=Levilactobacillus lindianensis TaxID=2486018 RepID=UPI000F749997|nr:MucBP domain-containing protein [Levilactobacillus lindianensis]
MAFFDWIKRLIEPKPRRRQPQPVSPTRRLPSAPLTRAESPVTPPQPPIPPRPSKPQVQPKPAPLGPAATLVVRLVDESDRPLQPALVMTGHQGEPIHYHFPDITGYALLRIEGFTQDFISEYGLTTVIYRRRLGQPVIAYLVDFDSGRLLELPQIHRGGLATSYTLTPPNISGYHIFQAQGPQRGRFTDTPAMVVYYYRRDAWQMVQRVHQYVFLQADHQVYDEPAGLAYNYQFPADSLWRLFMVVTLTNGDIWYNFGGNQWLAAEQTVRRDHQVVQPALPPVSRWQPEPFDRMGTVDYVPGSAVSIYREPYGETAGQIDHGDPLDIRGRIIDDQQLVWYQIGPEAYINARYVRLTPIATL